MKKVTIKMCFIFLLVLAILIPFKTIDAGISQNFNSKVFYDSYDVSEKNVQELLRQYDSVFYIYDNINKINENNGSMKNPPMNQESNPDSDKIGNEIINEQITLKGNYFFKFENLIVNGEIYTSDSVSEERLNVKIKEIQAEIKDGSIMKTYSLSKAKANANILNSTSSSNSLIVSNNWTIERLSKVTAVLDHKNKHYGDYSEWRTMYKLQGTIQSDYYAFTNESYIVPDGTKTDYRTDKIVYSFDPTLGGSAYLRDYAPKMKNPTATIGYTASAKTSVNSNGEAEISSEISDSYSTLVSSPKVYDKGNMAKDYGEIQMQYLNTFDNKGQFYEYNISQTYQSSTFIILVPKSVTNDIIISDNRIVGIQRDSFWVNQLVDFHMDGKITINR